MPVVVGGTGRRGVVSAASYEARAFGVHSAMPTAEARRLLPAGGVRAAATMRRYASRVAADLRDLRALHAARAGPLARRGVPRPHRHRAAARPAGARSARRCARPCARRRGLAVSVGIAPVKMVAKIASDLAKPDGLLEVAPGERARASSRRCRCARLWGVGPGRRGAAAGGGLRDDRRPRARGARGARAPLGAGGLALSRLARGEDLSEVEPYRDAVSYSEENTFADDVSRLRDARARDPHARRVGRAAPAPRRLRGAHGRAEAEARAAQRAGAARLSAAHAPHHAAASRPTTVPRSRSAARALLRARGTRRSRCACSASARRRSSPRRTPSSRCSQRPRSAGAALRLNRALDAIGERFGADALVRGPDAAAPRAGLSLQRKRGEGD